MKLGRLAGLVVAMILSAAAPAGAVTITEFDANPKSTLAFPVYITSGPEGNLWWTDTGAEAGIARMTPSGERLPRILDANKPIDVVVAPSGWASWVSEGGFGSRSPSGTVTTTESALHGNSIITEPGTNQLRWGGTEGASATVICHPVSGSDHFAGERNCSGWKDGSRVTGLAASTAGVLWASIYESGRVRIFEGEVGTKTIELPEGSGPCGIAVGPEGNAWIAMWEAGAIDRIAPDGTRARFPLPAGSKPNDIVLGPDGAFWITESGTGKIGRMNTSGVLTNEYPIPSGEPNQIGITVGPDQNIWFTDPEAAKIGRLVPDPLALPGPPAAADTVRPKFLGTPSFSPHRFRVAGGRKAHASRAAAPIGAKLKFALSEPAKVTATIARKVRKRKGGYRYVKAGKLSATGKQGANRVPFSGKLKGRALAPGKYRATLIARDGAGNVSPPKTAGFAIVR